MRTLFCSQEAANVACPIRLRFSSDMATSTSEEITWLRTAEDLPTESWTDFSGRYPGEWRKELWLGMEHSNNAEWEFRYALIHKKGQLVAWVGFMINTFSGSALSAILAENAWMSWVGRWLAKKQFKMLIAGNGLLSGEPPVFYNTDALTQEEAHNYLLKAIDDLCIIEPGIQSVLLKDFKTEEALSADQLKRSRFKYMRTEPYMNLTLSPEWVSWEHYLLDMFPKYRQRARSAYKKSKAIQHRPLTRKEIIHHKQRLFDLATEVIQNGRKFHLVNLSVDYFPSLTEQFGDDFQMNGYFLDGELIAFTSHIHQGTAIEAHIWGYHIELNRKYKLYQRMLYDNVQLSINAQVPYLGLGRTAMEIKSTIGATGQTMHCYLKVQNRWMNRLNGLVLSRLKDTEWTPRTPFRTE